MKYAPLDEPIIYALIEPTLRDTEATSLYQFSRCLLCIRFLRDWTQGQELLGPFNAGTVASAQSLTVVFVVV